MLRALRTMNFADFDVLHLPLSLSTSSQSTLLLLTNHAVLGSLVLTSTIPRRTASAFLGVILEINSTKCRS